MIYLDNAATSFPKPDCVIDSMVYAQKFLGNNPGRGGHKGALKAGNILKSETRYLFTVE
jgi:selenocysteine lyase/cysteine desulfurase